MKKAGYLVAALGVAVIIFAIVCFISAGSLLSEIEQYMGIMGGYMDAGDMLDLALASGFDAGDFRVFAYQARVWLLVGGLALLAVGVALIFVGRKNDYGRYGQYAPAYGGYDEYDDVSVTVAHRVDSASIFCRVCGTECSAEATFCRNCGSALSDPEPTRNICPACGAENDADANFCCECGQMLGAAAGSDAEPVSEHDDWEAFRPEAAPVAAEAAPAAEEAASAAEEAAPAAEEAAPAAEEAAPAAEEEEPAVAPADVPDEPKPAETVRVDTRETADVFRKSDSFDASPASEKPAAGNPFLRKAGDL